MSLRTRRGRAEGNTLTTTCSSGNRRASPSRAQPRNESAPEVASRAHPGRRTTPNPVASTRARCSGAVRHTQGRTSSAHTATTTHRPFAASTV